VEERQETRSASGQSTVTANEKERCSGHSADLVI